MQALLGTLRPSRQFYRGPVKGVICMNNVSETLLVKFAGIKDKVN